MENKSSKTCFYCNKSIRSGGKKSPRGSWFHKACWNKYFIAPKRERREY